MHCFPLISDVLITIYFAVSEQEGLCIRYVPNIWHYSDRNPPILDECQSQSVYVMALPREQAHQASFNDTLQPTCEFQVRLPKLKAEMHFDIHIY